MFEIGNYMTDRDDLPSTQPSNVTGSVALVLGFLTFVLLFFAPRTGLALIVSILSLIVGLFGLQTGGRDRAGLGMAMGVMGGALSLLFLTAIPM
ncbi:MAG: hypothetical protein JHD35_18915 [Sphingopyxis sp.]|nr:hypothetical protein [Sphingopyxis sp.]